MPHDVEHPSDEGVQSDQPAADREAAGSGSSAERARRGRTGQGAEAMPDRADEHTTEHESGYGGKGHEPRVSSDQRPDT